MISKSFKKVKYSWVRLDITTCDEKKKKEAKFSPLYVIIKHKSTIPSFFPTMRKILEWNSSLSTVCLKYNKIRANLGEIIKKSDDEFSSL